jgi:hypothetical protein
MNLARQSHVRRQLRLNRQSIPFHFTHLFRISVKDLDTTSCTACVATTPVKNVNARIFDRKDELLSSGSFCLN